MSPRLARRLRLAFCLALTAAWAVAVYYMWDAMTTVPTAGRLEQSRMAEIPTPTTFYAAVFMSGFELAVVLAILWPWRPEYYASRIGFAALALVTWFVMTTPMDLTRMDWVHRRWLAFMIVTLAVGLVGIGVYRAARRLRGARRSAPA